MRNGFLLFWWNIAQKEGDEMSIETTTFKTKTAFGLGFSIAPSDTLSRWEPADYDKGIDVKLFAKLRLEGFAGLLSGGFAEKLVIASGMSKSFPNVSQAVAIRSMLIQDFDIDPDKVEAAPSDPNTKGNIAAIKRYIEDHDLLLNECAGITSHYHVPRALADFVQAGLLMPMISAEAALYASVAEGAWDAVSNMVRSEFGTSEYTEREIKEITGIAHKMTGTFKERPMPAVS